MSNQVGARSANVNSKTFGLERWLDETVNKNQPVQLPSGARTWIADNSWWLAIIGGVVSLWGAWSFWQIGHYLSGLNQLANEMARLSGSSYSTDLGVMWYVALAGLVVEGVLLLLAVPLLKDHKKTGWDLLYYVSLVSLFVGLVYLFVPGYGVGSLIGSLLGAAISWFFLFQIRSRFAR